MMPHHQQQPKQQTPAAYHHFHPYIPPPHHRLQQQYNGNAFNMNNHHKIGTSKQIKSFGGTSATSTASTAAIITAAIAAQKSRKTLPLGASPSYHMALDRMKEFYEFRDIPNLIARTNHSTVHKVFSIMYKRDIAIKIIDKRAIPPQVVDKFLPRELEITRLVYHPHVVRCLHIMQPHPTKVAIISEFYPGGTLLHYVLKRYKLSEAEGARVFRQICEAIFYLHHTLGVAHRDIKMENILMDRNNDVKIADFGFARYISQAQSSTSYCGTKPYSSPQLVDQRPYNPYAADWYACGVVLYTMLNGKWPHNPKAKCVYPLQYPKELSKEAATLIDKLMHPNEKERAGYTDIVNGEWMKKAANRIWTFTDDLFVYDIEAPSI